MEKWSWHKQAMENAARRKKPRTLGEASMDKREQQQDEGEERRTLDNVTLYLDALECPLCFSLFEAPIFQCKNGHPVWPLEAAIAAMFVPCAFAEHGCTRRLRYAEKAVLCHYAPCAAAATPATTSATTSSTRTPAAATTTTDDDDVGRRWAGHYPTEGFMFVPDAYWSSGAVSVKVHVRKLTGDEAPLTVA